MNKNDYIFGIHSVIESIEAGKDIDKILLKKDFKSDMSDKLFKLIKEHNIFTQRVPIERINRITSKNHQGIVAILSPVTYYSLENLIPQLFEEGETPFFVILDGITDVRNFGAIARTCECAGVNAIIIPERNSVSVNSDSVKTSAGALLHIPVCRVRNLSSSIKLLKDSGISIIGTSDKGALNYTEIDFTLPSALVLGSEDTGISDEILKKCDYFTLIPEFGKIQSLNVSVAAGIIIYEGVRQRMMNEK